MSADPEVSKMAANRTVRRTGIGLLIATLAWLTWIFLPERVRRSLDRLSLRHSRETRRRHDAERPKDR